MAADALVSEAGCPGALRVEEVPSVHEQRCSHRLAKLDQIDLPDLGPFGNDYDTVCARCGLERRCSPNQACLKPGRIRDRIPGADLGALGDEP